MNTGTTATTATAAVATEATAVRCVVIHEVGRRCAPCSTSRPTAIRKARNSVSNGANWSGRISLRTGSVDRSRQGSHGCPSHAGALSR